MFAQPRFAEPTLLEIALTRLRCGEGLGLPRAEQPPAMSAPSRLWAGDIGTQSCLQQTPAAPAARDWVSNAKPEPETSPGDPIPGTRGEASGAPRAQPLC